MKQNENFKLFVLFLLASYPIKLSKNNLQYLRGNVTINRSTSHNVNPFALYFFLIEIWFKLENQLKKKSKKFNSSSITKTINLLKYQLITKNSF
jgi:hypothetical protein